jgi:hypothetical protein
MGWPLHNEKYLKKELKKGEPNFFILLYLFCRCISEYLAKEMYLIEKK